MYGNLNLFEARCYKLATRTQQTTSDIAEQDYNEKAEDAVDYEDIDEEYDGPEVQTATEEDFMLSQKDFLSRKVSIHTAASSDAVFDDENYDDDEDLEKKDEVMENAEVPEPMILKGMHDNDVSVLSLEKTENISLSGDALDDSLKSDDPAAALSDTPEEEQPSHRETVLTNNSTPLPVLYVEDYMVVLRFSEIFGIYEPRKKAESKERVYPVPKEMYKSMDFSEIIEEDEEAFLKGSLQDVCDVGRVEVIPEGNSALLSVDGESRYLKGTGQGIPDNDHGMQDSCRCSVSFKADVGQLLSEDFCESFYQNFCPLDQLDWEDRIIWSMYTVLGSNVVKSDEISGADTDTPNNNKAGLQAEPEILPPKPDDDFCNCPVLLEPFDIKDWSESIPPEPQRYYHPQLLRIESRLDQNEPHNTDSRNDGILKEMLHNDTISRFKKLTMQNRAVLEGSWVDDIIWEPQQPVSKPHLILDLEDEQMLFEVTDNNDGNHLWRYAAAMVLDSKTMGSNGDYLELHVPGDQSDGHFNISNDNFYTSQESSQQAKSPMKKCSAHGLKVLHSTPALKLQTMKVKLSNKAIANFHRPKALWYPHDNELVHEELKKLSAQGPMKIILKSLGGKGCIIHVDADETILSVKAKASKKLDFKLSEPVKIYYSGKELEDEKSLSVQSVRPNSLLHLVRTKVSLLPRAQKIPSQNKSLRPPGAFKKKSDLSVKDGHVFLMEYCEERPLLLGNAGMGARLCTYYQKLNPGDQTGSLMRNENSGFGNVFTLDPSDKSPFLGDIKLSCSQSSLETNMYRAPIYKHKVSPVDYLLVRSAKGKLSIRRIDRIDVVGQQEPLMEVMAPASKNVKTYIMDRLLVFMYRKFSAAGKDGARPSIRADELSAQFPTLLDRFLQKKLKHCADLQQGRNSQLIWVMKPNFRIPSEEELRRMVTPENACAYESMQAGLYRLKRLGISSLTQLNGLLSAMNQLPDEAIALAAASHIERELQITPWNLSINFVSCASVGVFLSASSQT